MLQLTFEVQFRCSYSFKILNHECIKKQRQAYRQFGR